MQLMTAIRVHVSNLKPGSDNPPTWVSLQRSSRRGIIIAVAFNELAIPVVVIPDVNSVVFSSACAEHTAPAA
jgi:hypothetical protein